MNLRRRIMSPSLAALRLQCTPRQTFQTGYGGRIRTYVNEFQRLAPFQLGHSVTILNWWTWHDLNVRPRPSQSRALIPLSYRSSDSSGGERAALTATSAVARSHHRNLAEAAGVEPAHAMRGDLANRCHTIRRRLLRFRNADCGFETNPDSAFSNRQSIGGRDRTRTCKRRAR